MFNLATWKDGEKAVKEYMIQKGYNVLYTNFSCAGVEIDIVATKELTEQKKNLEEKLKEELAKEPDRKKRKILKKSYEGHLKELHPLLIITEVKARSTNKYGAGKEQLSTLKKYHMQRGAEFLLRKPEFKDMQIRFDVASVDNNHIEYIENAFPFKS